MNRGSIFKARIYQPSTGNEFLLYPESLEMNIFENNSVICYGLSGMDNSYSMEFKFKNEEKVLYDYGEDFDTITANIYMPTWDKFMEFETFVKNNQTNIIENLFYNISSKNLVFEVSYYDRDFQGNDIFVNKKAYKIFVTNLEMNNIVKNDKELVDVSLTMEKLAHHSTTISSDTIKNKIKTNGEWQTIEYNANDDCFLKFNFNGDFDNFSIKTNDDDNIVINGYYTNSYIENYGKYNKLVLNNKDIYNNLKWSKNGSVIKLKKGLNKIKIKNNLETIIDYSFEEVK